MNEIPVTNPAVAIGTILAAKLSVIVWIARVGSEMKSLSEIISVPTKELEVIDPTPKP